MTVADTPDKDEEGYFLLDSAEDMAWLQDCVNKSGRYGAKATLACDIDISSLAWEGLGDDQGADLMDWQGMPSDKVFSGVLDGCGHTLTVAFESEPLVTMLSGTVKDLTIEGTCAASAAFATLVTYGAVLEGNAKVAVSKSGKVTVKKGLKKGKTYKVKVLVTAAGGKVKGVKYAPAIKTVTLKVKVAKK